MKRSYPKILRNRKRRIQRRLNPKRRWSDQAEAIMSASNIDYGMAEKAWAVNCGGIGAIHLMVNKLGLRQEIDSRLHLLKKHLPYHESDHLLNLTSTRCWRECDWRISNCSVMMRPSSMGWAPAHSGPDHQRRLHSSL